MTDEDLIHSVTGLVPISRFHAQDTFIVAYPKSGITWFQNIVAGIVYGCVSEYVPDIVIQDLVPDIHYKRFYKRYQECMYFKSHSFPTPQYRRVVYLLRDGRDAMVSYFHHNFALHKEPPDFYRMVKFAEGTLGKWHEHAEGWLDNPHHADMITIRYEDLRQNPFQEMRRFCEFAGMERDDGFLEKVVACTSFDVMQRNETRFGWDNPYWPKEKRFVRRGQIGSYRDEMPIDVLEAFLEDAGPTLRKLGYR